MEYSSFAEANAARQIEWLSGATLPLTFRTNELAGEFGEVCELLLGRWVPGQHYTDEWRDSLGQEMADCIICCEIIVWQLGVSIDYARAEGLAQRVGNDYQWCAKVSRDLGLLCNITKKVDRTLNGIAGGIELHGETREMMRGYVDKVVRHIYDLAFSEQMYMEVALARKFNKTSAKVGLSTLYIPPGFDRALLIP